MAYTKSEGMLILDTDASKYAYGGVLSHMQLNRDTGLEEERVIAYASRNFSDVERRYCTRKSEMTAIIRMIQALRCVRSWSNFPHSRRSFESTVHQNDERHAGPIFTLDYDTR